MVRCQYCEKVFQNKSNLNRHARIQHAEEVNEDNLSDNSPDTQSENEIENAYDDGNSTDSDGEEIDVWRVILKEAHRDNESYLQAFKNNVKFCRSFDNDITVQTVIKTMDKGIEDEDMNFDEALDYATDKRKFLIEKVIENAEKEGTSEDQ